MKPPRLNAVRKDQYTRYYEKIKTFLVNTAAIDFPGEIVEEAELEWKDDFLLSHLFYLPADIEHIYADKVAFGVALSSLRTFVDLYELHFDNYFGRYRYCWMM